MKKILVEALEDKITNDTDSTINKGTMEFNSKLEVNE